MAREREKMSYVSYSGFAIRQESAFFLTRRVRTYSYAFNDY